MVLDSNMMMLLHNHDMLMVFHNRDTSSSFKDLQEITLSLDVFINYIYKWHSIPYSMNVWQRKTLANHWWFAKFYHPIVSTSNLNSTEIRCPQNLAASCQI